MIISMRNLIISKSFCPGESQGNISFGNELLLNGGFDSGTVWSRGAGWTISGGLLNDVGSTGTETSQSCTIRSCLYKIEFDIVSWTSGQVKIIIGSDALVGDALGHFSGFFMGSSSVNFIIHNNFVTNLQIDNVSLKEVFDYED
jgi:hypothetical protein